MTSLTIPPKKPDTLRQQTYFDHTFLSHQGKLMFHPDSSNLTDAEQVEEVLFQAMSAQEAYLQLDQHSIDKIILNMARIGASRHLMLAKLAVADTRSGIVEDKSITTTFSCSGLEQKLKTVQTVGIIEENEITGSQIIAEPVGILASLPTAEHSTAITLFQSILSVKTRNPIVFCFQPSVQSSSQTAVELMMEAAQNAGAPRHAIQFLPNGSAKSIKALIEHPEISLILMDENTVSAPTPDIPVLGSGRINSPCYIDRSADIEKAATDVIASRHFDNGLIPSSEQTVIISREVYFQTLDLLMQKSCYLTSEQEKTELEGLLFDRETGAENYECTGQSAVKIARMAGFTVPEQTKLLLTEIGGIGPAHPFSRGKTVPVLAILAAESWYEGLCFCEAILDFSSSADTAVLHARDRKLCDEFSSRINADHIILNQPATRGDLCPHTTSSGYGITRAGDKQAGPPATADISIEMLIHRKTIRKPVIRHREWKTPGKLLFTPNCSKHLQTLSGFSRTLIITKKELLDTDHIDSVLHYLGNQKQSVTTEFFCNTKRVVTIASIEEGIECMTSFRPTALLAIGEEVTIDTAKAMRYFYQNSGKSLPLSSPDLLSADFPDCLTSSPQPQVNLITIPTTPGAGFNINGFVTIFNDKHRGYRDFHSCELLPDITLIDADFAVAPKAKDIALTGLTIISRALEAYVSPLASDYSDAMALKAIHLIFEHLQEAVESLKSSSREKLYNAAAMAGIAAGNAKSGLSHAMTQSLRSLFEIAENKAHSLLLPYIIQYNGVEDPSRFNPLMPGSRYVAHERYQDISRSLGLDCKSPEQGVESLIQAINTLRQTVGVPDRIRDYDIKRREYFDKTEQMAESAFENSSTATNPRLPLIREIIDIYDDLY